MKRYYYMDVLNILATFAVILLHTSEYAFSNHISDSHWVLAVIIQVTFIWSVPIFFMLSGANLLDYRERYDTKTFFEKRLHRILLPFVVWTVVWYLLNPIIWQTTFNYNLGKFIDGVMHNNIQPIFWFFYFIIGFYISVPLISKITVRGNEKLSLYLLALNCLFVNIIGYYYMIVNQPNTTFADGIQVGTVGSVGFFVVGWYLNHHHFNTLIRRTLYGVSIISLLVMIGLTIYLSAKKGVFQRNVYSIWGIFGFTLSIGVFEFFKENLYSWQPSGHSKKLLEQLSGASLGVYVIHQFIINIFETRFNIGNMSYFHIVILPFIVWVLSMGIVLLLQKIPFLRKIV
ncbi:MAG: acyltransferase family protein [Leuconostoc pseudomesenteroides]|uniref:acyltransferase n=1 Tax=Leuconostoc pseudomesenteroides TaxID=33968 RepID=UPI0039EB95A8